jgi:hypothetical protein
MQLATAILSIGTKTMCQCSFGSAPTPLKILPTSMINVEKMRAATVMDNVPNVNVGPFGTCNSLANPAVASATAAAFGVLTPQACTPVTTAPWTPGSPTVSIGKKKALTNTCTLQCQWGGTIIISNPGANQTKGA